MAADDRGDVTERHTLIGDPAQSRSGRRLFESEQVQMRGVERVDGGPSLRPDITTVPLENVGPSHVVLATRAGDRGRLVTAFRKLAEAHLTGTGAARAGGD